MTEEAAKGVAKNDSVGAATEATDAEVAAAHGAVGKVEVLAERKTLVSECLRLAARAASQVAVKVPATKRE